MSRRATPRERVVTVQASALETITTEVFGSAPDLETGGILLGYAASDSADLHSFWGLVTPFTKIHLEQQRCTIKNE